MKPSAAIRGAVRRLGDLLIPPGCPGCGQDREPDDIFCPDCRVKLLDTVCATYCPRCGESLGPHGRAWSDGCWACPTPLPAFGRVVRLGTYQPPLNRVIRQLKFYGAHEALDPLARMLAEAVQSASIEPADLIVPVPMHWRRRLWRGIDHADLLADALSRSLGWPVGAELIRTRHTPQQTRFSRTERLKNVRGAFGVTDCRVVDGARVLLVDDVTTTTATASECARTLLKAGAASVDLAVLGKALRRTPEPSLKDDRPGRSPQR
jgi:ComF family protein